MSIIDQAKAELERINFGEEDSAVMIEILEKFLDQWDSGGAVAAVAPVFMQLLAGGPLSPLTGEDDEWMEISDDGPLFQNKRCGSVFKDARTGRVYDIDSNVPVTFPYQPKRQVRWPTFEVAIS